MANTPPEKPAEETSPEKARSDTKVGEAIQATVVPPPPPSPGASVQIGVATQLIQGSRIDFHKLDKDIQAQFLLTVQQMDRHSFEHAQHTLQAKRETDSNELKDRGEGRKHVLIVVGGLAVLALLAGTAITAYLIHTGQPQLAHTVMMSGLAVISALLGGAGLSTLISSLVKSK